jgi:hypothetical protein
MQQPSNVEIIYQEGNDKFYVFVEGNWVGKHYNFLEALKSLERFAK